jgi:hypothetical protein
VPTNPALATYDDAVSLLALLTTGLADQALFSPADQVIAQTAQANLQQIVSDGPGAFDAADVTVLLNTALDTLAVIARVGCLAP